MSLVLLYFFMAVGLSMYAFSLAIVYGTNNLCKKKSIILSIFVGILHFIMPNLGNLLGKKFLMGFILYSNIIVGLVFLILALEMIFSFKDDNSNHELKGYIEIFLFAVAVSIDSFSVGMALSLAKNNLILGGVVFSIVSFLFTLFGLFLGRYLGKKTGTIGKVIGILILILFSLKYLLGF